MKNKSQSAKVAVCSCVILQNLNVDIENITEHYLKRIIWWSRNTHSWPYKGSKILMSPSQGSVSSQLLHPIAWARADSLSCRIRPPASITIKQPSRMAPHHPSSQFSTPSSSRVLVSSASCQLIIPHTALYRSHRLWTNSTSLHSPVKLQTSMWERSLRP